MASPPVTMDRGLLSGLVPNCATTMRHSHFSLALLCGALFAFASAPASAAPQ